MDKEIETKIEATGGKNLKIKQERIDDPPAKQSLNALTLAALAASIHDHGFNDCSMEVDNVDNIVAEEDKWNTVGIFKTLRKNVIDYVKYDDWNSNQMLWNSDNIPDLTSYTRVPLEHGNEYRFRVAGINLVGLGEYSEPTLFKTCLPGFPGPPCDIEISRTNDGVHLSWEPPNSTNGEILAYSVFLAVNTKVPKKASQLAFVCVYCGPENQCFIAKKYIKTAYLDMTSKPANLFRVAARNVKGYGPATQVRWVQVSQSAKSALINTSQKRPANKEELLNIDEVKKVRDSEQEMDSTSTNETNTD